MIRRATFRVGLFGLACLVAGADLAAGAPTSSPYPSREVIRGALSDLSDAEVGALVRGRLHTAPSDRGRDLATAASALDDFRARFNDLVAAAGNLPGDPAIVVAKLREGNPGWPARLRGPP